MEKIYRFDIKESSIEAATGGKSSLLEEDRLKTPGKGIFTARRHLVGSNHNEARRLKCYQRRRDILLKSRRKAHEGRGEDPNVPMKDSGFGIYGGRGHIGTTIGAYADHDHAASPDSM